MQPKQSNIIKTCLLWASWLLVLGASLTGCQSAAPTLLPVKSPLPIPTYTPTEAPAPTGLPPATASATIFPTAALSPTPVATLAPEPSASPQPSGTPAPCQDTQGQVLSLQTSFDFYAKPLQFELYLPPCYNPAAQAGYPLLFLLHGQGSDDQQWIRLGAATAADRLISSGQSVPFIIAMPYEEYDLQDPADSSFPKLIIQGLLPWLDQHYRTCTERACRAIGGLSRGAAWAVRLGFTDWQQFGEIGAHSLAYFWGDNVMLRQWTRAIPADQFPLMYLDIGNEDRYLQSATQFEGLLTQYQVPHTWLINQGIHNEDYWRAHVEEYLRWYSQNWKK